jgi:hypothetical protein
VLSDHDPDLILWLDHSYFRQNEAAIDSLKRGDKIQFFGFISKLLVSASEAQLGVSKKPQNVHFENKYPHIQTFYLKSLGKKQTEQISDVHHLYGRYSAEALELE